MNAPTSDDGGIDPDDYRRLFFVDPRWLAGAFALILALILLSLFWFNVNMRERAGRKIAEATAVLARADTLPASPTLTGLELQEMVTRTEEARDWLLAELNQDSFPRRFRRRLEKRYLDRTYHYELPDDWRSRLPPRLEEWARRQKQRRRRAIRDFLDRLPGVLDSVLRHLDRAETLARTLPGDRSAGGVRGRFRTAARQLRREVDHVRRRMADDAYDGRSLRLPPALFREAADLPDPLTRVALHYRRLTAFTSVPDALVYAERTLRDALRLDPDNPLVHYHLGGVYRRMGLEVLGREQRLRALRLDPDFERAGQILKGLRRRVKENPNAPRAHYDLGFALHVTGHPQEARRHLLQVLRLASGESSLVTVLARKRLKYLRVGVPEYSKLPNF